MRSGAQCLKNTEGVAYDCVVIGGGLRIPPKSLALFEMVVNAVHKAAPAATIAFNTRPEDTAEAAARQLDAGYFINPNCSPQGFRSTERLRFRLSLWSGPPTAAASACDHSPPASEDARHVWFGKRQQTRARVPAAGL